MTRSPVIQTSTSEVEGGVKLVREADHSLREITEFDPSDQWRQMDFAANSAREKSSGLLQINVAVNQLHQTTQQNAAMVEQSTAAVSALAAKATRLRALIGRIFDGITEVQQKSGLLRSLMR